MVSLYTGKLDINGSSDVSGQQSKRARTGRKHSGGYGYVQERIKAAENMLKMLAHDRECLEQANSTLRNNLQRNAICVSLADEHLQYAVRMHCAHQTMFSREALTLMAKENANQVI